jgi:hypothetical protein
MIMRHLHGRKIRPRNANQRRQIIGFAMACLIFDRAPIEARTGRANGSL